MVRIVLGLGRTVDACSLDISDSDNPGGHFETSRVASSTLTTSYNERKNQPTNQDSFGSVAGYINTTPNLETESGSANFVENEGSSTVHSNVLDQAKEEFYRERVQRESDQFEHQINMTKDND